MYFNTITNSLWLPVIISFLHVATCDIFNFLDFIVLKILCFPFVPVISLKLQQWFYAFPFFPEDD